MSGERIAAIVKGSNESPRVVSLADILMELKEEQEIADEQTARRS